MLAMESLVSVLCLSVVILVSPGSAQNCTTITFDDIASLLPNYASPTMVLVDFNVTCLALSKVQDKYRYVTVMVIIQNTVGDTNSDTSLAMIDIGCSTSNHWNTSVLGAGSAFMMLNSVSSVKTRLDCSVCAGEMLLTVEGLSDPHTHCVACSSSCTTGVGGCTGPTDKHCCAVYQNGLCAHSCSSGYQPTTNHTCIPVTYNHDNSLHSVNGLTLSVSVTAKSIQPGTTLPTPTLPHGTNSSANEFTRLIIISSVVTGLLTLLLSITITLTIVFTCCGISKMIKRGTISSTDTQSQYIQPSQASPASPGFVYLERNPSYCIVQAAPRVHNDDIVDNYDIPGTFRNRGHAYMTVIA